MPARARSPGALSTDAVSPRGSGAQVWGQACRQQTPHPSRSSGTCRQSRDPGGVDAAPEQLLSEQHCPQPPRLTSLRLPALNLEQRQETGGPLLQPSCRLRGLRDHSGFALALLPCRAGKVPIGSMGAPQLHAQEGACPLQCVLSSFLLGLGTSPEDHE